MIADTRWLAEAESRGARAAKAHGLDTVGWGLEVLSADFSDAYMHLGVHKAELRHCYAAHPDTDKVILWTALCFGLKSGPLVVGPLRGGSVPSHPGLVPRGHCQVAGLPR